MLILQPPPLGSKQGSGSLKDGPPQLTVGTALRLNTVLLKISVFMFESLLAFLPYLTYLMRAFIFYNASYSAIFTRIFCTALI